MVKPLTPKEAVKAKLDMIPDFVIEAFNSCIVKNMGVYGTSKFKLCEVIEQILNTPNVNTTRQELVDNKWLDVEKIYRDNGWKVIYDSPDIDEDYEPYFIFSEKSL